MKYIDKYDNTTAYNNAKSTLNFPHVGYITATTEVKYDANEMAQWEVYGSISESGDTIRVNDVQHLLRVENGKYKYNYQEGATITRTDYMFCNANHVTTVDKLALNIANVTNMARMFYQASLTSINTSDLNTSNVTNMEFMFAGNSCTNIDCSGFNVGKVTSMNYMFAYNSHLTTANLNGWKMKENCTVSNMFYGCSALRHIYMNGTDNYTFETIKNNSMKFTVYKNVTIHRDGLAWNWVGGVEDGSWQSSNE